MTNTFITKAVNARDFQTQIDNLNTKLDIKTFASANRSKKPPLWSLSG